MTDFHKLARPLMRGVKTQIRSGTVDPEITNKMVRDILGGMPAFVGEIVIGKPEDPECYLMTKLFLETETIMHPFIFWIYDMKTVANYALKERLLITRTMVSSISSQGSMDIPMWVIATSTSNLPL